ncbi:hypothetical protein MRX96_059073 [Rhipicephalus microplus]
MGESALKSHMKSAKHVENMTATTAHSTVRSHFTAVEKQRVEPTPSSSTSSDVSSLCKAHESVVDAEILWTLKMVTAHYSTAQVQVSSQTDECIQQKSMCVPNRWKEAREKTTGSAPSAWPFFVELHRFLGTPPINDRSLVQESCPSPRGNVDEIIRSISAGSSVSADENGATESCSSTDACSSASDLQQDPQPSTSQAGTSTSQTQGNRRAQKRKRMSANEKFQSALLEQQANLIAALKNATQVEQGLHERQVATQEKLVDLFSKYFNK